MESALTLIQQKIISIWLNFVLLVPNLMAATIFLVVAWYGTKWIARFIAKVSTARNRSDPGSLLGSVERAWQDQQRRDEGACDRGSCQNRERPWDRPALSDFRCAVP